MKLNWCICENQLEIWESGRRNEAAFYDIEYAIRILYGLSCRSSNCKKHEVEGN